MTICKTCKHINYCEIVAGGYSSKVKSCRDYRKGETTNEEWFASLSTEEKAKWLSRHSQFMYGCEEKQTIPKTMYEEDWEYWLKQPHKED